jgi:hypothetical protein
MFNESTSKFTSTLVEEMHLGCIWGCILVVVGAGILCVYCNGPCFISVALVVQ